MWRRGLVVLLALAGCGGSAAPRPTPSPSAPKPTATATATATAVAIAPGEQPACDLLYARLQRATLALSSSSELIAHSQNKKELSTRLATQQEQLRRSARLLDAAVVPAALQAANRSLVSALRTFASDFGKARKPAAQGDFQGAVTAMTDQASLAKVLAAAQVIEATCRPRGN
jgi:hypothetical protein